MECGTERRVLQAYVANGKEAMVKEEQDTKKQEEQAKARQSNADFCR